MGKWKICMLGTDGYGRSDTREKLREFFEIDSNHIAYNALVISGLSEKAKEYKRKYHLNF